MTRSLFAKGPWSRARTLLETPDRRILIGLDLDGTLAPLAPRPELARVPGPTLRAIRRAARAPRITIAILSARPLHDLRRLLPVRGLMRIGQYGLEGPLAPVVTTRTRLRRRCARVTRALMTEIPRTLLEPKGLTVAVHSRNVKGSPARRALFRAVRSVAAGEAREQEFVPMPGAEIVDFVPRGQDKGRPLRALRARLRPDAVFYFGDSDGDEPAFRALGRADFPVRVGRGETRARFRVAGLGGVTRFLVAVTALRAGPA